jgi:hypothetical protein
MPSDRAYDLLGFDSPGAYTQRLLKTPQNLVKRVFMIHPADEQMEWRAEGKHDMKRVLVGSLLLHCCSKVVHCPILFVCY